jgi:hypothetical protein
MGRETSTFAFICCSNQPRVGTTLTARLLLDFLLSAREKPIVFDTNLAEPQLARVFPRICQPADISTAGGQMALFDQLILANGTPKIVDLWHAHFEMFVHQVAELGLNDETLRSGVQPVLLLHSHERGTFRKAYLMLEDAWRGARIVLVHSRGVVVREHGSWAASPFYEVFIQRLSDQLREGLEQTQWLAFRSMLRPEAATSSRLEALARVELVNIYEQLQHLIVKHGLDHARFL